MQLTSEAATKTNNLGFLFVLFITIYAVLLVLTAFVLRLYFKRHPVAKDLTTTRMDILEQDGVETNG